MARHEEAMLNGKAWDTTPRGSLNLKLGGQNGWMNNLAELHNNQAYIPRNLVLLAVEPPRFLKLLPNPEYWMAAWKALIEKHPYKVSGFKQGLNVSTSDHDVGGAGEKMDEATNVMRDRTQPVLSYIEKETRPIQRFLDFLIRFGIMDPDTKFALISTLTDQQLPNDWLFDWYAGTVLAYETDVTHRFIDKAWLTTNFFPKGTGNIDGTRELPANKEILTLDIEWAGVSASHYAVVELAQRLHDKIQLANANPSNRPAFVSEIAPELTDIARGYKWSVEETGRSGKGPLGGGFTSTNTSGG